MQDAALQLDEVEVQDVDYNTIRSTAYSVMTDIMVECNKWMVVIFDGEMFPGIVKKVFDGTIRVQCMEYEKKCQNSFRWPTAIDVSDYEYENIIGSIEALQITGVIAKNKRKDVYTVDENDWDEACKIIDAN